MRLVYFAWVREKIGAAEEDLSPPASVTDITSLIDWLKSCDDRYAAALGEPARLRFAVNQDHAGLDHSIGPEDEVAIFPPVTGG